MSMPKKLGSGLEWPGPGDYKVLVLAAAGEAAVQAQPNQQRAGVLPGRASALQPILCTNAAVQDKQQCRFFLSASSQQHVVATRIK